MKVAYNKAVDKHLWDDFLSGDFDAFDQIYNDYVSILFSYAKKFTIDDALIEDIIQDFFVDLWYGRKRLSRTDNIKLYLFKSIRRRVLRTLKNEKRKSELDHEYISDFRISIEPVLQTEGSSNLESKLKDAVNELSEVQKEIVFLKFYNNCNLDEISEILNLPKKSVYNGLFNAMKALKNMVIPQK